MGLHQITKENLQTLVDGQIVEIRGISGIQVEGPGEANKAASLCGVVRMHAMSSAVYELCSYMAEIGTFNVEEVK